LDICSTLKGGFMHKYGWIPDKKDFRDVMYKAQPKIVVPDKMDLRLYLPPMFNQGPLGSCVWNALGNAHLYCQLRQDGGVNFIPSRLFGYYNSREFKNEDTGCYIRAAAKSIGKIGICPEALWNYDITKFAKKPDKKCYKEAEKHKAINYYRLDENIKQLQKCLAEGFPVVLGITLYESFESNEVAKTGIVSFPSKYEATVGGHAVLIVGYDNSKAQFIGMNSWGEEWGDKGFFYIGYDYITELSSDWWTIRVVKEDDIT